MAFLRAYAAGGTSGGGDSGPAEDLESATTVVNVSAATAPTTGQVLTATGATSATWQTPAAGGGTLDSSYDFGGAGAGRSVTVDAGAIAFTANAANNDNALEVTKSPAGAQSGNGVNVTMGSNASGWGVKVTHTGIGTGGTTKGINAVNTTVASSGNQQYSPSLVLGGQGWKTTATAASQAVDFALQTIPVQGSSAPTGSLHVLSSINGGAFTSRMNVSSAGVVTAATFTSTTRFLSAAGTGAAPGYSFSSFTGAGISCQNAGFDYLAFSVGGSERFYINGTRTLVVPTGGAGNADIGSVYALTNGITWITDAMALTVAGVDVLEAYATHVRIGSSASVARLRMRGFFTASPSDPPTDECDMIIVDNGVTPVVRFRYNDAGVMKIFDGLLA